MAKGDFYKSEDIFKIVPDARGYIPAEEPFEIGVSKTRNIKYKKDDFVSILKPDVFPKSIYEALFTTMVGSEYQPSGVSGKNKQAIRAKISLSDLRQIAPTIHADDSYESYAYTAPSRKGLYYKRIGKKGKLKEFHTNVSNAKVLSAVCDIMNECADDDAELRRKVEEIVDSRKTIEEEHYELSKLANNIFGDLAKAVIKIESPCVFIECTSHYLNSTRMFRLDCDNPVEKSMEKIAEYRKELVQRHNEEQLAQLDEAFRSEIRKEVAGLFKTRKHYTNISTQLTIGKRTSDISMSCKTEDGTFISAKASHGVKFKEEYKEQKSISEDGLFRYELTANGRKYIKQVAKEFYESLLKSEWEVIKYAPKTFQMFADKTQTVNRAYKLATQPIFVGDSGIDLTKKLVYDFKAKRVCYKTSLVTMYVKDGELVSRETDLYKTAIHDASLKRRKTAEMFFEEKANELKNQFTITYQSGSGVLLGNTSLCVSDEKISFIYDWHITPFDKSLSKWKKEAEKNFLEIQKKYIEEKEKARQRMINELGIFAGNYVAIDVIEFIRKNEKYITENATVSYLRGLAIRFSGYINGTDKKGLYKPISSAYIENIIDEMIRKNFIYTRELKGTYGRFNILKTTAKSNTLKRENYHKRDENWLNQYVENEKYIRDCYAEDLYQIITQKEKLDLPDYMKLTKLVSAYGFVCNHYSDYIQLLKNSPKEVKMYLKMRKEMTEDDFEKKVLIASLK